jgi:hypothetical protein
MHSVKSNTEDQEYRREREEGRLGGGMRPWDNQTRSKGNRDEHPTLEAQLSGLSRAEKAELVQRLVYEIANTWPGIEKTAGAAAPGKGYYHLRKPVFLVGQGFQKSFDLHSRLP